MTMSEPWLKAEKHVQIRVPLESCPRSGEDETRRFLAGPAARLK